MKSSVFSNEVASMRQFFRQAGLVVLCLLFFTSFKFHSRLLGVERGVFSAMLVVLIIVGLVWLNISVLYPKKISFRTLLLYVTKVIFIQIGLVYLVAHSGLLSVFDVQANFRVNETGMLFVRESYQIKTFTTLLASSAVIYGSFGSKLAYDFLVKRLQEQELLKEKRNAEYAYLRAQMNPHFFLNALNGLYALMRLNPEYSEEYLERLSEMLHYHTYKSSREWLTISEEIEYINNYIYFEQKRRENLRVHFEVEVEDEDFALEPMLLTPFVENAFKHGESGLDESAEVWITINEHNGQLEFSCRNTIPQMPNQFFDDHSNGIGIENVKRRLAHIYQDLYCLQIEKDKSSYQVSLILKEQAHEKNTKMSDC